jgi:hypothetical protein
MLMVSRCARVDGAFVTSIELNHRDYAEVVEPGPGDEDPVMLWHVDLRCQSDALPGSLEEARAWLLQQAAAVRDGVTRFLDLLRGDLDAEFFYVRWGGFPKAPAGARLSLWFFGKGRERSAELVPILEDFRDRWEERLRALGAAPAEAG